MTPEEKQLLLKVLLKDLCARLPYDPFIKIGNNPNLFKLSTRLNWIVHYGINGTIEEAITDNQSICKPYLRPMSSMTEEEKNELCKLCDFKQSYDDRDYFSHYGVEVICEYCVNGKKIPESFINYSVIDFFYEHHLDWRGLIPMGLALEAKEGMYKTE